MKMFGRFSVLVIISILILPIACTRYEPPTGIVTSSISSSIGGDPRQQVISYWVTIQNNTDSEVRIIRLTPVLPDSLAALIANSPDDFLVDKTIAADSFVNVTGKLFLKTNDFTKEEIAASGSISRVKVESTVIIGPGSP